jgi:hypothetical protein
MDVIIKLIGIVALMLFLYLSYILLRSDKVCLIQFCSMVYIY